MNRERREELKGPFQKHNDKMVQVVDPANPFGFKDHRGYHKKQIFMIKCGRAQHRVLITADFQVVFLDHGNARMTSVLMEANLQDKEHKGCAHLAYVLLNLSNSHAWTSGRSRRTPDQKRAFDAGLPDCIYPVIGEVLRQREKHRGYRNSHRMPDEYAVSFKEDPGARVAMFLALRSRWVWDKMAAVARRLEKQGVKVKSSHYIPRY